jgi:lysozyme family protein
MSNRWNRCVFTGDGVELLRALKRICANVEMLCREFREMEDVPREFLAVIWEMEASSDRTRQILNGQPWNQKTTIHPRDMGPWVSWREALIEAIRYCGWDKIRKRYWIPARMLVEFERHNGMGYRRRGLVSPYVWGWSNQCPEKGLFVKDGVFDPEKRVVRPGAGVLLKEYYRRKKEGTENG